MYCVKVSADFTIQLYADTQGNYDYVHVWVQVKESNFTINLRNQFQD